MHIFFEPDKQHNIYNEINKKRNKVLDLYELEKEIKLPDELFVRYNGINFKNFIVNKQLKKVKVRYYDENNETFNSFDNKNCVNLTFKIK